MSNLSGLTECIYSDEAILSLFSGAATVGQMLAVEAALAKVQGQCGVIPASAAAVIDAVCLGGEISDMLDMDGLATAAVAATDTPVIALSQAATPRRGAIPAAVSRARTTGPNTATAAA